MTDPNGFERPDNPTPLEPTGERLHPEQLGEMRQEHIHRYRWCLSAVENKDVLDVASGEGYGSAMLAARARSVVGVDISERAVRHAASRYSSANLEYRVGRLEHLPLDNSSIDIVVCFETIEHLLDQAGALKEIARVLRPGGIVVMSTPNVEIYTHKQNHRNEFHLKELGRRDFIRLLSSCFPAVRLYGQRLAVNSVIMPEAGLAPGSNAKIVIDDGTLELGGEVIPDLMYYIAVAAMDEDDLPFLEASVLMSSAYDVYWQNRRHIENLEGRVPSLGSPGGTIHSELQQLIARASAAMRRWADVDVIHMVVNSGYFDADFYRTQANLPEAPLAELGSHYLEEGERLGLQPSALFDPVHYANTNPDVVDAGYVMLVHYIVYGQWEGRSALALP